jgi:hypothetical protein
MIERPQDTLVYSAAVGVPSCPWGTVLPLEDPVVFGTYMVLSLDVGNGMHQSSALTACVRTVSPGLFGCASAPLAAASAHHDASARTAFNGGEKGQHRPRLYAQSLQ